MALHPLLDKQIKAYLPSGSEGNSTLLDFITAINATYLEFDSKKVECQQIQSEEKEAIEALKRSEEKYKNIIEKSTDIIYKTNQAGFFTFVNPVAERITEFSQEELLDKHFSELIREDFRKMANSIYRKQISLKKATTYLEFPIITKSGKEKWIGQSVQYSGISDSTFELTALAIDVTDRKIAEKTILLREEKYRNIIANINMGLVEVDLNEVIRYCNQGFCDLSGFTKEELIGKNIVDALVFEGDRDLLKDKTQERSSGISDIYEIQIKNKKGEVKWWMVSGAPNYDDAGNLIGSIGIHLDVTERKLLEQQLKVSKRKAEESSKAKESFLANMSHEIRTPLNAIIGMIRELSYENLTEFQRIYVQNTSTASQHLLSVLNNILDISKIEAGEFHLEEKRFDLEILIKNALAIMKNSASEKSLFLTASVSKDLSRNLIGDPTRIRQIILNLVGNAVKFTEKGGISIHCHVEKQTRKEQTLLVSIKDTGIGMGEEYVKKIFTKFSQEDVSTARNYGGTGLGMAITRELIQLMKGTIDVKSKRNEGTTITLKLKLPVGETMEINEVVNFKNIRGKESIKVLLTEDNEFNRLVATKTLNRNNCVVTIATNGAEAIEKIKKQNFDVILMDLQMPVMDGIEATKRIRNDLHINIPIIALSANAFKTESDHCFKIGMNDYVTKPFEEKSLMDSIYKNLGTPGNSKQIQEEEIQIPADEKLYSISELNDLTGGDKKYLGSLVDLFINQTTRSLKQLKEAVKVRDMKTVFELSHQMKPAIDGFKINLVKTQIREIETDARAGLYSDKLEHLVKYLSEILQRVIHELRVEFNDEGDMRPIYEYQP